MELVVATCLIFCGGGMALSETASISIDSADALCDEFSVPAGSSISTSLIRFTPFIGLIFLSCVLVFVAPDSPLDGLVPSCLAVEAFRRSSTIDSISRPLSSSLSPVVFKSRPLNSFLSSFFFNESIQAITSAGSDSSLLPSTARAAALDGPVARAWVLYACQNGK